MSCRNNFLLCIFDINFNLKIFVRKLITVVVAWYYYTLSFTETTIFVHLTPVFCLHNRIMSALHHEFPILFYENMKIMANLIIGLHLRFSDVYTEYYTHTPKRYNGMERMFPSHLSVAIKTFTSFLVLFYRFVLKSDTRERYFITKLVMGRIFHFIVFY